MTTDKKETQKEAIARLQQEVADARGERDAATPPDDRPPATWEDVALCCERMMGGKPRQGVRLKSIKCYRKDGNDTVGWIVSGSRGSTRMVCFHDGASTTEGLLDIFEQWQSDSMDWKPDQRIGSKTPPRKTAHRSLPATGGP